MGLESKFNQEVARELLTMVQMINDSVDSDFNLFKGKLIGERVESRLQEYKDQGTVKSFTVTLNGELIITFVSIYEIDECKIVVPIDTL